MTDTLLTRLERYGDDLDRAIELRRSPPGHRLSTRRAWDVPAFAAACILLAGVAAAIALGGGDTEERITSDTPAATTITTVSEPAFESSMEPLLGEPPAEAVRGQTEFDGGTVSIDVRPNEYIGVSWTRPGQSDRVSFVPDSFDTRPIWCCGSPPPGRESGVVFGAVGPNGALVEVVQVDGTRSSIVTREVPGVPGPRVFLVDLPSGSAIDVIHVEDQSGTEGHRWSGPDVEWD